MGFKDVDNLPIKLVNSQICAYQNGGQVLDVFDYYDIMKGFRKGDLFNISPIIKMIKDVLLFDVSYQELESVIEVNKKFAEQISIRLDVLEKQQSSIDQKKRSLNEGTRTYRDFILNKENPILARIEKMKAYRKWLIEFRDNFLKGEMNIQGNYDKCNLNISEIKKLIGTENTFGNMVKKIDVKSLNLVKELSRIGDRFKNSMNVSENIKNDKITYFEFFHSNFNKLKYSDDSTCDNSTDYDLSSKLQCISENEDKFYLQKSITDFTKLELGYNGIKDAKSVIGYPGMYEMYQNYKKIHPFFYNEVETAIKNYQDELIEKKQKDEIKRAEQEKTKQEVDKKKKEQDAKVVEIQKAIIEENKRKKEILTAKQEMDKARREEEQVIANQQLLKDKQDKTKNAEDKIKQLEEREEQVVKLQKIVQEKQAQAQVQAEAEVAEAEVAEVQAVEEIPTEVATIEQVGGNEPYITFDINKLEDDDIDNLKDEGYWLRYEMNSKVFLDREKYGDMKYIYLLNQNCSGFGENSILWSSIKSQPVDITFTNEINTSIKSKDIMCKYITSIMDEKMSQLPILSVCCQYRLRNTHSRADAMLLDEIRKKQWDEQTFFGSTSEYDIMDSKDMWTIQKNVNRKISDEEGNTSNDPHWMDLGVAKKKYPESISSLDDMLLDNNSFRRKAAFTSLIKYATSGD